MCYNKMTLWGNTLVTLTIILCSVGAYLRLPDTIAVHYSILGFPDRWGSKGIVLWLVIFQLIQFLGLTLLSFHPEVHNYPILVTPENKEALYKASSLFTLRLSFLVSLLNLFAIALISGFLHISALVMIALLSLGTVILFVGYFYHVKRLGEDR